MHFACERGCIDFVSEILRHPQLDLVKDVLAPDTKGDTALMLAVNHGHDAVVAELLDVVPVQFVDAENNVSCDQRWCRVALLIVLALCCLCRMAARRCRLLWSAVTWTLHECSLKQAQIRMLRCAVVDKCYADITVFSL